MSQKKFTNATGNWSVGSDDHINYSSSAKLEGTIQATDFLDGNGNSIITQALSAAGTFVTKNVNNRVNNSFKIENSNSSFVVSPALVKAADFQDADGNSIKVDLSNYYTSTESDARYQPIGNYQPAGNYQPEGNYPQSITVNTFVTLTQAQYDALSSKNSNTIYFIQE